MQAFSGLDVPPDSARIISKTLSWDLNFSYSLSRTALKCSKFPFLFGKTTLLLPSPASFNAAYDSWDGVLFCSGSDNTKKAIRRNGQHDDTNKALRRQQQQQRAFIRLVLNYYIDDKKRRRRRYEQSITTQSRKRHHEETKSMT